MYRGHSVHLIKHKGYYIVQVLALALVEQGGFKLTKMVV